MWAKFHYLSSTYECFVFRKQKGRPLGSQALQRMWGECEISVDARRLPEVSGLLEAAEEEAGEDCLGVQVVRLPPLPVSFSGILVGCISSIDTSS